MMGHKQKEIAMTIQETTAEIRKVNIELRGKVSHFRMVRLYDKLHDLEARYDMLLRIAGLERP